MRTSFGLAMHNRFWLEQCQSHQHAVEERRLEKEAVNENLADRHKHACTFMPTAAERLYSNTARAAALS
jgi:hypothetical protein